MKTFLKKMFVLTACSSAILLTSCYAAHSCQSETLIRHKRDTIIVKTKIQTDARAEK